MARRAPGGIGVQAVSAGCRSRCEAPGSAVTNRAGVCGRPLDHGGVAVASDRSPNSAHLARALPGKRPGGPVWRAQAGRPEDDHGRGCREGDGQDSGRDQRTRHTGRRGRWRQRPGCRSRRSRRSGGRSCWPRTVRRRSSCRRIRCSSTKSVTSSASTWTRRRRGRPGRGSSSGPANRSFRKRRRPFRHRLPRRSDLTRDHPSRHRKPSSPTVSARRARTVSDGKVADLIARTLEPTPDNAAHWSTRSMAKRTGLSQSTVSRVWRAFDPQPHRLETIKLSTDPFLVDRVHDVVGLYLDPPERALVLCVDEKSQIQALDRSQPGPADDARGAGAGHPRLHVGRHHHPLRRVRRLRPGHRIPPPPPPRLRRSISSSRSSTKRSTRPTRPPTSRNGSFPTPGPHALHTPPAPPGPTSSSDGSQS